MIDRQLAVCGLVAALSLAACGDSGSADDAPSPPAGGGGGADNAGAGGAASGGAAQGGAAQGGAPLGGGGQGGATGQKAPEQFDLGLSAGCGLPATAGLDKTRTIDVGGTSRSYWRLIPNGYDPNAAHGLVVVLHGSGGSGQTAYEKFKLQNQGAGKFVFLYPDALPDPMSGEPRWDTAANSDDYAFFDAIVAEAEAELCIDRDRLFVTGFSLGARFTSMLGCYRGDVIRAIAPGAPGMNASSLPLVAETEAGHCRGEVGAWVFWGTEDPDHQEGAALVRDYYSAINGCAPTRTALATPAGCEAYDQCPAAAPVTWCTYTLNHQWPDGQNVAYNGQRAAMDFFKSFPSPYLP